MIIDGVSQSTGVERVVEVESADAGVLLIIRDRIGNAEQDRCVAAADSLMTVLTDRPPGPQTVSAGDDAMTVEVRRNEVWLTVRNADAAVGLDDLMDALAGALPP